MYVFHVLSSSCDAATDVSEQTHNDGYASVNEKAK